MPVTTRGDTPRLFRIYLNDHLAEATGVARLGRRLTAQHRSTPTGPALARVATEIAEDRQALLRIMDELAVPVSRYRSVLAWATVHLGRLRLHGRLLRRSPLSAVWELETLMLGVDAKAAGWRALRTADVVESGRLDELLERADRQSATLEVLRVRATDEALGIE